MTSALNRAIGAVLNLKCDLTKMFIYIAWLLHDLIQNIETFKLNTGKIMQYKVGLTRKSALRMLFNSGSQETFLNENVKEPLNLKVLGKKKCQLIRFLKRVDFEKYLK